MPWLTPRNSFFLLGVGLFWPQAWGCEYWQKADNIGNCVAIPCPSPAYNATFRPGGARGPCQCSNGYGPKALYNSTGGLSGCGLACESHPTNNPCRDPDPLAICEEPTGLPGATEYSCRCSTGYYWPGFGPCSAVACGVDKDDSNPCNTYDKYAGCTALTITGRYECKCSSGFAYNSEPGTGTCESVAQQVNCEANVLYATLLTFAIPVLSLPSLFIWFYNRQWHPKSDRTIVFHVGLAMLDLIGDLLFAASISPGNPCTPKTGMISKLFLPSVVFIVLPLVVNFIFALREYFKLARNYENFQRWQMENETGSVVFLVMGFMDTALCLLLDSHLFDWPLLSAPLPSAVVYRLKFYGLFKTCLEDIPQLIIQGLAVLSKHPETGVPLQSGKNKNNSKLIAQISLILSLLTIFIGAVRHCVAYTMTAYNTDPNATRAEIQTMAEARQQGMAGGSMTKRMSAWAGNLGLARKSHGGNAVDNLKRRMNELKAQENGSKIPNLDSSQRPLNGVTGALSSSSKDMGKLALPTTPSPAPTADSNAANSASAALAASLAKHKAQKMSADKTKKAEVVMDILKERIQAQKEGNSPRPSPAASPRGAPGVSSPAASLTVSSLPRDKTDAATILKRKLEQMRAEKEKKEKGAQNGEHKTVNGSSHSPHHRPPAPTDEAMSAVQALNSRLHATANATAHLKGLHPNHSGPKQSDPLKALAVLKQSIKHHEHKSPSGIDPPGRTRSNSTHHSDASVDSSPQSSLGNSTHHKSLSREPSVAMPGEVTRYTSSQSSRWSEEYRDSNKTDQGERVSDFPDMSPPPEVSPIYDMSPPQGLGAPFGPPGPPPSMAPPPGSTPPPAGPASPRHPQPGPAHPDIKTLDLQYSRLTNTLGEDRSFHDHLDDEDDEDHRSVKRWEKAELQKSYNELTRLLGKESKDRRELEDKVFRAMRSRGCRPERMNTWDVQGVADFLGFFAPGEQEIQVRQNVRIHGLDGTMLYEMDHGSLNELGMTSALTRVKVLAKIHQWNVT